MDTVILNQILATLAAILQNGTGGGSGGSSSVTVLNPSTNYSLETTQQTSIARLADILAELQGTLQVQEQNPITGFNLEATQQSILTELQKAVNVETSIFIDSDEDAGSAQYIVFRDSIYNIETGTYTENYYKIDDLGNKIAFNAGLSAGIVAIDSVVMLQLELIAQALTFTTVSFVDNSGTITTANTSQQILSSNNNRNYLLIQNVSDTDMWINFNAAATTGAGSIKLLPNGSYELVRTSGGRITSQPINIICSVAGKEFTAKAA